ncbi:CinA family protein [Quisquiliibacterium transsilvanicum]|uniref:PncC family amidohydrolase n=1 Tax=Quisquiliibacterium transsilvanicum TaxID=1549638 RepID=A0A7W8HDW4_9BURK|nr:CinA family protein [Quisquiliibacterium transsilvanicum]MBB5270155.1 PncC family amidohydrolase [Quisquiliibacterium transsilvanicum]
MNDAAGDFRELLPLARQLGETLRARGETVAVGESSAGGLISAALLSVPGASAYFLGGGVVYTRRARSRIAGIAREEVEGMRSSSEPYAALLARRSRERLSATWGLSETGAAGPEGNSYGDPAGHSCIAVAGPSERVITLRTGSADRVANMHAFARRSLELLAEAIASAPR